MAERYAGRRCLTAAVVAVLALAGGVALAQENAVQERMKKDIFFLASDECEGRGNDTEGINKAADYIVNEFKKAGLKPGGVKGTYFQPFTINLGAGKVEGTNTLQLRGPQGQQIELKAAGDFQTLPFSATGKASAPVVFVGYGIAAPELKYDEYKDLDVAGKVVVLLRRAPRWNSKAAPFGDAHSGADEYATFASKFAQAELKKAAAVLLVNDHSEDANADPLLTARNLPSDPVSVPVLQLRRSVLDELLRSSLGTSLRDVEKDIDRDLKPRGTPLKGWTAAVETTVKRQTVEAKNILGVVEGAGPLANETVVIGAHYDHWGYGGAGSLAKDKTKKQIHPGADDNGSGTTSVMELARRFAAMKDRQGRRLVFMLFSGEERGLLGSRFYCNKQPLFPLADTVAMVNLDMVGRLRDDKLLAEGLGTGKGFEQLVEKFNEDFHFKLKKSKSGLGPSDHDSFCRKKIPVLFFWTDKHPDYHRPSDTSDRINLEGMAKVAALAEKCIQHFATVAERPEYVTVASTTPSIGPGFPRLGISMDYNDESNKGVYIEDASEGGPAAKAGIKSGDRIVAVNGEPTPNPTAYFTLMRRFQGGQTFDVTISRGGKEMKLKVVSQ